MTVVGIDIVLVDGGRRCLAGVLVIQGESKNIHGSRAIWFGFDDGTKSSLREKLIINKDERRRSEFVRLVM